MKESLHSVVVLVLDHLSARLLFLPLELIDSNIILLLLRLENLRADLGVVEHVGKHVLEILNAQALEASQYIGDIGLDYLGLLLGDGILFRDMRGAPVAALDLLTGRGLRLLVWMG